MESGGLGLQRRENTLLTSVEHAYAWRSTTWWKNAHAPNLLVYPTTTHYGNTSGVGTIVGGSVGQDHPMMVKKFLGEKDKRDFETLALETQMKGGSSNAWASGQYDSLKA